MFDRGELHRPIDQKVCVMNGKSHKLTKNDGGRVDVNRRVSARWRVTD